MNKFRINTILPSLNDYVNVCRTNRYKAAQFKREVDDIIGWAIKQALIKGELKRTDKPCIVRFNWIEKNKKRDCDNIASAKKYILDALQKQGVIVNDNQNYIQGFEDIFSVNKYDYGVEVELVEVMCFSM